MYGIKKIQRSYQANSYTCGSRSVYIVLRHFKIKIKHSEIKILLETNQFDGTKIKNMIKSIRDSGLSVSNKIAKTKNDLKISLAKNKLLIAWVDGDHFVVVHGIDKKENVYLADPIRKKK